MNKHTFVRILHPVMLALAISAAGLLAGCTQAQYTEDDSNKVTETARPIAEAWLKTLPGDPEITALTMEQGAKLGDSMYAGYYATNVAGGTFELDGETYLFYVDTENGQVYSDYYLQGMDLDTAVQKQLVPYFEKYGYPADFQVSGAYVSWRLVSHGIKDSKSKGREMDTEITIPEDSGVYSFQGSFVLPVELNDADPEKRAEQVLSGSPLDGFDILIDLNEWNEESFKLADDATSDPKESVYGLSEEFIRDFPEILKEYLTESGNYRKEFGYLGESYYRLNVMTAGADSKDASENASENIPEDDVVEIMELRHSGYLQEMSCKLYKTTDVSSENESGNAESGSTENNSAESTVNLDTTGTGSAAGAAGSKPETSHSQKDCSIEIKYRSAVPFERSPVFTETDGVIRMSFNGNKWYTAKIITVEERNRLVKDREVLAETSNMKAYDTSDDTTDDYQYTYVFEPAPDSGYCIRFDTDAAPEGHDLAKDFTTSVQYFVDGTEVVPEIPGD